MKKNKLGAGRLLKPGAIVFKKLSDLEVIKLITENKLTEVAKMFDVQQSFVSMEITKRNLFEVKNMNRKRHVPIISSSKNMFSKNEDDYGVSYWMNGCERIAINQLKKIINN